jgi:hypothetical protein
VGKIERLAEELGKYLLKQAQLRRKLNAWTCPGETVCAEEGGERVYERRRSAKRPDLPILEVCQDCEARESKPELRPPHLAEAIATAYRLISSERITYQWPDSLTPTQWACLQAAEYAESRARQQADRGPGQMAAPAPPQGPTREHLADMVRLAHGRR